MNVMTDNNTSHLASPTGDPVHPPVRLASTTNVHGITPDLIGVEAIAHNTVVFLRIGSQANRTDVAVFLYRQMLREYAAKFRELADRLDELHTEATS